MWLNIRFNRLGPLRKPLIKWFVRNVKNRRIGCFNYRDGASVPMEQWAADHRRRISLTQLFSEHMDLCRDYTDLRNELVLTEEEIATFGKQLALPARYMVVKPTGPTGWTPNKEWGSERFQEVVYQLPEITWVQTGERSDPLLQGTHDLRGRTDLRQLFYVISRADGVLGREGVYNHIASAFGAIIRGFRAWRGDCSLRKYEASRVPSGGVRAVLADAPLPDTKPCTSDITPQQVGGYPARSEPKPLRMAADKAARCFFQINRKRNAARRLSTICFGNGTRPRSRLRHAFRSSRRNWF